MLYTAYTFWPSPPTSRFAQDIREEAKLGQHPNVQEKSERYKVLYLNKKAGSRKGADPFSLQRRRAAACLIFPHAVCRSIRQSAVGLTGPRTYTEYPFLRPNRWAWLSLS